MRTRRTLRHAPVRRQRGVGAVLIVMVLFFAVSLAAAYASRTLIFEQKTSSNQMRSTLAFEAADAALNWTLAQLNGGLISANCDEITPAADNFQQRYLDIDADGWVRKQTRSTSTDARLWPTCTANGGGWDCRCPTNAPDAPSPGSGATVANFSVHPAFRVWLSTAEASTTTSTTDPWPAFTPLAPGLLPLSISGCTAMPSYDMTGATDSSCLNYLSRAPYGEGLSTLRVTIALRSGLPVPPAAAITTRTDIRPSSSGSVKLKVINSDAASGGYTVNTGVALGSHIDDMDLQTIPGTPARASVAEADSRLLEVSTTASGTGALTAGERMFANIFGMKRATYRDQPGLRVCATGCTATGANGVVALMAANPNRIIWVNGDLTVDADIGSATAPALLVVDGGTLTLNAGVRIYGFVYLTGGASTTSTIELPASATFIQGALVAEGRLVTHYASSPSSGQELTVTYDATILNLLRTTYGSWVKLGSGWTDFKPVT